MTIIKQTKFEVLPMGEYNAVITNADLTEGFYGEQVEFLFTIEGGEYDGSNLRGWASAKFSPRSNLYKWTRAAFNGKEIPESYDLDLNDLIGRKLNLMLTIKIKPEDGTEFNKIDGARPWRQLPAGNGQQRPQQQPQRPPAPAVPADNWPPENEEDEIPF